ncbi:MAG: hypothetical protein RSE12_08380 [Fuscovulum sp.]|nr:MAG: hypothetical protein RSE12_08380 [Fuscovulum sp.]
MGGSVEARVVEIKELDRKQTKIEISGTCVSACTLYLGAHNTCVKPNARLGFHGPSSALRGIPLVPREFDRVSMMMADYYPPKIRAWFLAKARYVFEDYITISGRQAIEMGAKPCS